ncbi:phage baseplate assembly protein V [Streptomyces kronopolitis]
MIPLYGTYSGIVVSAQDPQNRGRVRLRIPQILGTAVSGWAEPASSGTALPGDQVYVVFDGGDRSAPVYWPRLRSAVPGTWTPLSLDPGWVASSVGDPVVRATADGMIELAGSVETSTSIALGTTVRFAALPTGMVPLHRVRQIAATIYHSAYKAKTVFGEYRTTTSTTSVTYVTDPGGPSVDFVAPASGQAIITFGAFMQNSTDVGRCLMGVRVLQGATIVAEVDDNRSAEVQSPNNVSAANARSMTGLVPGSTYTVTSLYRTEGTSSTASFDNKWISVMPVGPHDTPSARVTVEPNGDLLALFPDGAAPAYDLSLAGIRVRAV